MDFTTIIGASGATLILIAFVMAQIHRWKDTDLKYDEINFIGGVLLVIYAVLLRSYPFFILNAVWSFVSFRDIILDIKAKKMTGRQG